MNIFHPLLADLVGPLQGSFIPSRGTKDNIILAQEVMHTLHTHKRRGGLVALKIDLEKAYDRVNWDFLQATLHDFGFPPSIVDLNMWGCNQHPSPFSGTDLYYLTLTHNVGFARVIHSLLIYLFFAWSAWPFRFKSL